MRETLKSKLVLVVEDDADSRDELAEIVGDAGYRVLTAANGQQALNVLKQVRPNLILLDLMMPTLTGWELLAALGADPHLAGIPVVVVSAYAVQAPRGVPCVLSKPISIEALLTAIRRHCA
jgi:CheY-like chemotaxis protein